jgi:hypothetical protein
MPSEEQTEHIPTLEEIAEEFELLVGLKNRRYRLKVYSDCFLGDDAVTFLVRAKFAQTREEGKRLGRLLAEELNLFEHVTQDYGEFACIFGFRANSIESNHSHALFSLFRQIWRTIISFTSLSTSL